MVQFLIRREKDPFDDVFFPKLVTFNSSHKLKHFCILGKLKKKLFVLFQTFSSLKLKQRKRNEKRKGLVIVFVKVFMVSGSK